MTAESAIPSLVPTLSPGRHRSPRQGACFMEFASYLAGERWSDHPACTDPTLALLARAVNDTIGDDRRSELVLDVPRVVGLRGDDVVIALAVAIRAATAALPIASMERQHALASGLIAAETALAELAPEAIPTDAIEEALASAPASEAWARARDREVRLLPAKVVRSGAPAIVATSVAGIASACVDDPESRLIALLRHAIDDVERLLGTRAATSATGSRAVVGAGV